MVAGYLVDGMQIEEKLHYPVQISALVGVGQAVGSPGWHVPWRRHRQSAERE